MKKTLEEIIRGVLKDKGITQTELGKRLNIAKRQNINALIKRKKMDVETLAQISKALDYNFFQHYYNVKETHDNKSVMLTADGASELKATLQIELTKAKKDQVLKLVFGENNLEIFNK